MKNIFTKIAATAVSSAVSVAIALDAQTPVHALSFNYNWQSNTGYSAKGTFSFDETTAPETFSESGLGNTNVLESLSVSFFTPSNTLIATYNPVVNNVSAYEFLEFSFNTVTKQISGAFDIGKDDYLQGDTFLTNVFDGEDFIEPGDTLYLFVNDATTYAELLDFSVNSVEVSRDLTTNSVEISRVPEPTSVLGLLVLGALSISTLKKKLAYSK